MELSLIFFNYELFGSINLRNELLVVSLQNNVGENNQSIQLQLLTA